MAQEHRVTILIVDDDEGHTELVRRNLRRTGIKADSMAKAIPVIMLTTTDDPREITRCYELGCNVYISKPVEPAAFIEAIRRSAS